MSFGSPLIGVTGLRGLWELPCGLYPVTAIETGYTDALAAAGGLPVMITPSPESSEALVDRLDALLVSGGPDIDPGIYGQHRDPLTGQPDRRRDALETRLVRAAVRSGKPVLAVCRGCQLVNAALGGTLHQHIDGHARLDAPGDGVHEVTLVAGSRMAQVLGADQIWVNSLHHQAIDQPAPTLVVSARAHDGTVEAVEHLSAPLLAVQWHPEKQNDSTMVKLLYRWLVETAATDGTCITHDKKGS